MGLTPLRTARRLRNFGLGEAIDVIDNWRASHAFPLNSFTQTLRNRARRFHASALSPQRIKRLESIGLKLASKTTMKLTQMQDIGGCRAVLPTLANVNALRDHYLDSDNALVHTFTGEKERRTTSKSLKTLDIEESILSIGLPVAPSRFHTTS